MKLFKTLFLTAVSRGLTAAGTFGLNVILARNLTLGEFGNISFCLVAVVTIAIFAKLGFDTSLLRFAGAAWHRNQFDAYLHYCKVALLTVTATGIVVLIASELTFTLFNLPWPTTALLRLTMFSVPFLSITGIIASCFKAAHRPETGALFEMGGSSLFAGGIVLASVYLGHAITVEYAAKIFVLSTAFFCIFGFLFLLWTWRDKGEKSWNGNETMVGTDGCDDTLLVKQSIDQQVSFHTYFVTSLDLVIVAGTQVLGNWSGVFFLEYFQGETATAIFSAARRTSLIPLLLVSIVVSIFSPQLAGLYQSGDHKLFKKNVHRSSLIVCLVNLPILILMAFGAPWWMGLFGDAYQPHWLILTIMSIGQLVGATTGIATGVMGMTGNHRKLRTISVVCALLATVLAAVLSATMGVVGAAIAAAAYAAGQSVVVAWEVRKQLGYLPLPSLN